MSSDDFKQIETDRIQKEITDMLAEIISSKISSNKMVTKGFLWKSTREWQITNKSTVKETEDGNSTIPENRIMQIVEMLSIFRKKIISVLEENELDNLDQGIKEAIKQYTKLYAYR